MSGSYLWDTYTFIEPSRRWDTGLDSPKGKQDSQCRSFRGPQCSSCRSSFTYFPPLFLHLITIFTNPCFRSRWNWWRSAILLTLYWTWIRIKCCLVLLVRIFKYIPILFKFCLCQRNGKVGKSNCSIRQCVVVKVLLGGSCSNCLFQNKTCPFKPGKQAKAFVVFNLLIWWRQWR